MANPVGASALARPNLGLSAEKLRAEIRDAVEEALANPQPQAKQAEVVETSQSNNLWTCENGCRIVCLIVTAPVWLPIVVVCLAILLVACFVATVIIGCCALHAYTAGDQRDKALVNDFAEKFFTLRWSELSN